MTTTEPHETSAGETGGREAMSDERLAELKRLANEVCTCGSSDCDEGTQFGLTPSQANEVLAEVERLNEVLHANTVIRNAAESTGRVYKSLAARLRQERDEAYADADAASMRAEAAKRALAELRERIGWGEQLSDEWGWTWRGHDRIEGGCNSEETARSLANHGDTIMRRIVSKWKVVDDA